MERGPQDASNHSIMNRLVQLATLILIALSLIGCHRKPQTIADLPALERTISILPFTVEPTPTDPTLLPGPNAVPRDTRIVVNIPAFRMDVFQTGSLLKSYLVGIGYPQFPVEKGLRKAELIIFNPTWTPPHSAWVTAMGAAPGVSIGAGSRHNPLGPIKVPIGTATLIHGGKPLSKIGTFASHGCVGMTDAEVTDFAKVLAAASETELLDESMSNYLSRRNSTKVIDLNMIVPVELRYETIVAEDGRLHIYRDVYGQNTNTEENLRAVLEVNGVSFDSLSEAERTQARDGLNQMSRYPKKTAKAKPTIAASPSPTNSPLVVPFGPRKKDATVNQKEIVIDIAALRGKGYPMPVALNTGGPIALKND